MPQAGNGAERTRRWSQYWSNRYSSIILIEWFCSIFITHLIQVCWFSFLKRNRTSKLSTHYNDLIYADLLDWAGIRKNCFILYHLKKFYPPEITLYCDLLYILTEFISYVVYSRRISVLVYLADWIAILGKTSVYIDILAYAWISMQFENGIMSQASNGAERTYRRSQYWSNSCSSIFTYKVTLFNFYRTFNDGSPIFLFKNVKYFKA